MIKFARKCDVTGRGMNEGWVWGEGTYYTSTKEVTIAELRSDIQDGAYDFDEVGADALLKLSDDELLQYAYDSDVLYYTEWEEIDDDVYYDAEGNEFKIMRVIRINTTAWEEEDFYLLTTLTDDQIIEVVEPIVQAERDGDECYDNETLFEVLKDLYPNEHVEMYEEFYKLTI
jgi:hypothetical protein